MFGLVLYYNIFPVWLYMFGLFFWFDFVVCLVWCGLVCSVWLYLFGLISLFVLVRFGSLANVDCFVGWLIGWVDLSVC